MNILKKTLISTASFTTGYLVFSDFWEENSLHLNTKKVQDQDAQVLKDLTTSDVYKSFLMRKDNEYTSFKKSSLVPKSHHANHASLGLLFGPKKIAIDPIGFQNKDKTELHFFCHIGSKLSNHNNDVHHGIVATFLDEALCYCGFNKLPSGRGVTGKLSIDFKDSIKPNTNLLISCKIKEIKGRKCVILGDVKTISANGKSTKLVSTAECTLIEPKWFKYFNWVPAF